ncbi:FAS1 domain-containing protein [Mucor mucedo]|uniref:FAS1 domain-containing protein n=1 Tax=Mucor mucedo TaxID=29922 RepID=UPI00221FFDEA|nr:FAS1 domain-containing protein [Mucor mucedo]KAI7864090.1 FAS1 domain-containing protein [Mucor mucedo]
MKLVFLITLLCGYAYAYKTLIDVLSEDAKFSTLIYHLQRTHLVPMINNIEAGTFFAPDNDAFEKYQGPAPTRELILYHLLPKLYKTKDLGNGQLLESSYIRPGFLGRENKGQMLKITEKLEKFFHINDARIKDRDVFVNLNTTMNVVDRVLEPPPMMSSIVKEFDEKLFELMKRADLDKLIALERPFTTFISAKYLLDKFNHVEKKYLTSEYGLQDLKHILKYLVISEPIYLDRHPIGETSYTTESGETLIVKVSGDNRYTTVDGLKVMERDILAANGVIHVLDDLPYADSIVFDTRKYLFGLNATKFVSLIDKYELGYFLDSQSANITILAPTNEVIDEDDIPNNLKKQWLSYHLLQGAWKSDDLEDRMLLKSEYNSSQLLDDSQRIVVRVSDGNKYDLRRSIQFGTHSQVIGNDLHINENVIYRVSDPLDLPLDIFTRLVIDLELSTFIATLYVSGVIKDIKDSKAITLFVPTNQAFKNLGLVARYLVHPSGKTDLQTVLKYHVATSPLYYEDLVGDVLEVTTLTDDTLIINGNNNDSSVWISSNDGKEEHGVIKKSDILVANGVVHKVDHIQIPNNVEITHQNLLTGISANLMQDILKRTGVLKDIELNNYLILTPTDEAFKNIDLESLWNDTEKLGRIARLHILPKSSGKKRWFLHPLSGEEVFETMLEQDKVVVRQVGRNNMIIRVKGQPYGDHARVLDMGRVSTGDRSGGVIEIDSVLFPIERGAFGLPWMWSFLLVSFLWIASLSLLALAGFIAFKKYKRRRDGYVAILEAEADDIAEEEAEQAVNNIGHANLRV